MQNGASFTRAIATPSSKAQSEKVNPKYQKLVEDYFKTLSEKVQRSSRKSDESVASRPRHVFE